MLLILGKVLGGQLNLQSADIFFKVAPPLNSHAVSRRWAGEHGDTCAFSSSVNLSSCDMVAGHRFWLELR
jgi:hypothetical protein